MMMKLIKYSGLSLVLAMSIVNSVQGTLELTPPKAKKEISTFNEHGIQREDPYYWLNQRDHPDVLSYLKAENDYTDHKMKLTENLQQDLYNEFKNRIKQDDDTVPVKNGNYFYYNRFEKNKTYALLCRKKENLNNAEEIMIDVNAFAKDHDYYDLKIIKVSPNEKLVAFAEDSQGRRKYKIKIKDLTTGKLLSDVLVDATQSFEWANDSKTLYYAKADAITLRSDRIYRHTLGSPINEDKLIYEEKDDTFYIEITKSKSKQFLMIASFKKGTTEFQILNANDPYGDFRVFSPRQKGHEYYVDHHQDKFIIRTNHNAANFKLMHCDLSKTEMKHWRELIPHQPNIYLEDFQVFNDFLAIEERKKGLTQIKIHPINGGSPYYVNFDEPTYMANLVDTPEMATNQVRFAFSSLKHPSSVFDFDHRTKQKILRKEDQVGGGYNEKNYHSERIFVKARDGAQIPVSLVYRKSKFKPHQNPLLLIGYGSYGMSSEATFNPFVISLLDRGFVFAIAHVRGGSDMGREWYFQGKLLNKKNTFYDFIDAAENLEDLGFADKNKMYAMGGSAGGLLMGAVLNMRPDLFKGVIALVPFVDVMNTMLDPSIPLTTAEYEEWGDPNDKTYYDYILSYSPYDNLHPAAYPHILVLTGYHDSQVQYWEPAKWVAKLREVKTDENLLILRTAMNEGHGGASGRYSRYQEKAFEYAFLLSLEDGAL